MKAKEFIREHKGLLIVLILLALFFGGWYYMWNRISTNISMAGYESSFEQFTFGDAHYLQCDSAVLKTYLPDAGAADESLCGERIGEVSFPSPQGTVVCPLYACNAFAQTAPYPLVIAERSGTYAAYELAGFASLDESPSAAAVCAAYGITGADAIDCVEVYDADGSLLDTLTEPADLEGFYAKLAALGADIGEAGLAKAYYDAYTAEYGETDKVTFTDGKIESTDDEAYDQAMEFWSGGMCLVTVRLKSGLQLRDAVYAPVPGVFSLYGDYEITVPFFS